VDFDAILFDNDGVLVDTERLYFQASREVLSGIGIPLDEADYVELFLRTARGAFHLATERGHDARAIDDLRAARDRRYLALISASDVVMPGVAELIPALASRYRLAIVSSSEPEPFARAHARSGLLRHFELVLTREHYLNSKPDPEPYRRAVEQLGLAPARCLVIEDSERGLIAAKAAGLRCWVIPSGLTNGGRFDDADQVLPDLAAAAALLLAQDAVG
jgi:HAD superfamily hydrolase (TIGR01509 family)